jgi:hypothetical protein
MCIGAEQQMPYFMGDRETCKGGGVGARIAGEPAHAVHKYRRKRPCANGCIDQRVSKLQLTPRRRDAWQLHEPHRQLTRRERRVARHLTAIRSGVSACEPGRADAGSGQDCGRRTQSDHLIRWRHDPCVVNAHLDMNPVFASLRRITVASDSSSRRNRRSVVRRRVRDTQGDRHKRDRQCSRGCVSHDANVRRAAKCLNALKVTRGETLVT